MNKTALHRPSSSSFSPLLRVFVIPRSGALPLAGDAFEPDARRARARGSDLDAGAGGNGGRAGEAAVMRGGAGRLRSVLAHLAPDLGEVLTGQWGTSCGARPDIVRRCVRVCVYCPTCYTYGLRVRTIVPRVASGFCVPLGMISILFDVPRRAPSRTTPRGARCGWWRGRSRPKAPSSRRDSRRPRRSGGGSPRWRQGTARIGGGASLWPRSVSCVWTCWGMGERAGGIMRHRSGV